MDNRTDLPHMFANFSIKRKLILIVMLVSSVVMLLADGTLVAYDWFNIRQRMIADLSVLATMVSDNCKGALAFNDPRDTSDVLHSLKAIESIEQAIIFSSDGKVFAAYRRDKNSLAPSAPELTKDRHYFEKEHLNIWRRITLSDDLIGTLYLQSDLHELSELITQRIVVLILLLLLALGPAYALSSRLQRVITQPLFQLTEIARNVTEKRDYSVRADKQSDDELGILTDAFNNMLAQIEKRDLSLTAGKERFRSFVEQAADAMFIHDMEGRILEVNQCACDSLGYSREKYLEMSVLDIETDYPSIIDYKKIWQEIKPGQPITVEGTHRRIDGTTLPVEIRIGALDLEGRQCILALARDISDRRKTEDTLLLTQFAVDHSSVPIIWFKSYNEMIYANKAACELTEYSLEELLKLPPGGAHPMGTTEYWDKYLPILKKEKSLSVELDLRKKSSAIIPVLVSGTYLEYREQEFLFMLLQDVSERKKMEDELRQAQKMEAIGTLAGGIAHDFNNILSAIYGYTELAKDDINDPETLRQDLDEILNGAERAKELVRQILTFSRKTEQEKNPLQISLIVKEALKLLRSSIPTTIDIKQNITSDALVLASPTQIHQIVMNLCTNAYHAMRETGGVLGVALKEIEISKAEPIPGLDLAVGRYLQLEISDSGSGMDEETKSKIFEPYFTTKELGEGTGLGLAVVHGVVKDHGGKINLYSEPGQGTTFHIYLPEYEGERDELIPEEPAPLKGGSETIMLVDDDIAIIKFAKKALIGQGYEVYSFSNGVQAYQDLQQHPDKYDLIVTDMTMPFMTGAELSQKAMEIRPNLPIILCTGHSELINLEKALAMGIKEYCEKPLRIRKLLQIVRQVLDSANL